MILQVKVPYTVSADITKYQGAPFNVHPDQFYVDQTKNEIVIASFSSMTEDTLTYKNLHHIKQIINQ